MIGAGLYHRIFNPARRQRITARFTVAKDEAHAASLSFGFCKSLEAAIQMPILSIFVSLLNWFVAACSISRDTRHAGRPEG